MSVSSVVYFTASRPGGTDVLSKHGCVGPYFAR